MQKCGDASRSRLSYFKFPFHYQYTHPIMQKNKFRNCLQILPVLFLMAFVSASCIKDDLSGCPSPHVSGSYLQVKAFDADGGTLGSETIKDITLYVFNADKTLLDTLHISLTELVTLDYPGHDVLKLVAWGNGRQGSQTLPRCGRATTWRRPSCRSSNPKLG